MNGQNNKVRMNTKNINAVPMNSQNINGINMTNQNIKAPVITEISNNVALMNSKNINAVRHWVTESTRNSLLNGNSKTIEARIQNILDTTPPLEQEILVYRGQQEESRRIIPYSWFSTSSDLEKVRKQHISNNAECCLFKIHLLPGVKCFQVDQILEKYGKKSTEYDESEIIVNGGGVFYANKDLSVLGFSAPTKFKGVEMFETWYAHTPPPPPSRTELSADNLFSRILEDEYELMNSQNNLKGWPGLLDPDENVSNTAYTEVWNRISKKKTRKNNTGLNGRNKNVLNTANVSGNVPPNGAIVSNTANVPLNGAIVSNIVNTQVLNSSVKKNNLVGGGRRMTRKKQRGGLAVFYNSVKVNGQELTVKKTAKRPTVKIPDGYFLVMFDSDAVNPDWIHWIATAEKDILEYQGPSPPPGTGIHTYKIVLNSGNPPRAPLERGGQKITDFLRNPVAVTEFTVVSK
jgi:hypothetical protein